MYRRPNAVATSITDCKVGWADGTSHENTATNRHHSANVAACRRSWCFVISEQLAALASHLSTRRAAILQAWRNSVDGDPELSAPSSLPRTQFNDHIPQQLDAFERRLRVWPRPESAASEEQRKEDAAGHGLQRWQQGYHLREVTREWGHLHLCLVDELENYVRFHPGLESRKADEIRGPFSIVSYVVPAR